MDVKILVVYKINNLNELHIVYDMGGLLVCPVLQIHYGKNDGTQYSTING